MPLFRKRSPTDRYQAFLASQWQSMYGLAYRLCGNADDAQDLIQDVALKLIPRIDELERLEQPRSWLARVIYRQFIDQRRAQMRMDATTISIEDDQDDPLAFFDYWAGDPNEEPDRQLQQQQLQELIGTALQALSAEQRAMIVLADMEGLMLQEIATVMELPLGTVKSRLHRARAMLRKRMAHLMEPLAPLKRVNE